MLFESLVPVPVHQACAAYEVRQTEIVNREVGKLKEATTLMNELLSSMNLPACLEETKGDDLPQSLKDKAEAVKAAGGVTSLSQLIQELPELLTRNTEILDEADRLLKEEKDSDDQLRAQFKDKWKRTPSDKLTSTFIANAQKYRTIINNATQADKVVKDKFETHKVNMEALSGGAATLPACMPAGAGGGGSSAAGLPVARTLRQQMEQVDTVKAERQVIESEFKGTKPEMRKVFLDAYHKEGSVNGPVISQESLARAFGQLQKQVDESVKSQESLMEEVRKNYEELTRQSGSGGSGREDKMKALAAAHDAYFELKSNLQEGIKFYNDLTQLLVTFQSKVSDFTFARKTEKDELMKDLTSAMSSLNMAPTPAAPAHHATDSTAAKGPPPARPPPPAQNPYAGAPTAAPAAAPPASAAAPAAAAGAPAAPNPYAGAPPGANPYAGAPYPPPAQNPYPQQQPGYTPYPVQPNMPYPPQGYAPPPMPQGYNPYGPPQGYAPYGQAPYNPYGANPQYPQQPPQYPPQNPNQPPNWR